MQRLEPGRVCSGRVLLPTVLTHEAAQEFLDSPAAGSGFQWLMGQVELIEAGGEAKLMAVVQLLEEDRCPETGAGRVQEEYGSCSGSWMLELAVAFRGRGLTLSPRDRTLEELVRGLVEELGEELVVKLVEELGEEWPSISEVDFARYWQPLFRYFVYE